MKRALMFLLASGLASPALAQHAGHGAPAQPPASPPTPAGDPNCPPEHAAMGHCKPAGAAPAASAPARQNQPATGTADPHTGHNMPATPALTPPTPPPADPHAGHDMGTAPASHASAPPPPPADPHAGHNMPAVPAPPSGPAPAGSADPHAGHAMPAQPTASPPAQPVDPHAGHQMGTQSPPPATADPHAGHDMGAGQQAGALPPAGPPPAEAFSGPVNAQDLFYDNGDAASSRRDLIREHGGLTAYRVFVDQAEVAVRDGREGYSFDAQAWYGGDYNKLWIKTEGEGTFGEAFEGAELQALWSRAIDPWFDAQLGVRQDVGSGPDRTYLVAGIQGLAPYWFEVEGTAFLSNKGDLTARFEGEYDLRLTKTFILQPRVEFDLAAQDVPELRIGSGLSTAEVGARLRYQFFPKSGPAEISPYVGIQYERAFGDTADFYRASGEDVGGWSFLVGLRTWF